MLFEMTCRTEAGGTLKRLASRRGLLLSGRRGTLPALGTMDAGVACPFSLGCALATFGMEPVSVRGGFTFLSACATSGGI